MKMSLIYTEMNQPNEFLSEWLRTQLGNGQFARYARTLPQKNQRENNVFERVMHSEYWIKAEKL